MLLHAVSGGATFGEMMGNMREAIWLTAVESGSPADFNMLIME